MSSRPRVTWWTSTCTGSVSSSACPTGCPRPRPPGTGTVFRQPILADYAQRAGFQSVQVLPIEDFSFFRFYQLQG